MDGRDKARAGSMRDPALQAVVDLSSGAIIASISTEPRSQPEQGVNHAADRLRPEHGCGGFSPIVVAACFGQRQFQQGLVFQHEAGRGENIVRSIEQRAARKHPSQQAVRYSTRIAISGLIDELSFLSLPLDPHRGDDVSQLGTTVLPVIRVRDGAQPIVIGQAFSDPSLARGTEPFSDVFIGHSTAHSIILPRRCFVNSATAAELRRGLSQIS